MTTREVCLDGGSPWGFRLHGGADTNQPLRISRVNPGSKAALRGIREGDFITSINGQSARDLSNSDAHALLRNSGDTLKLGLNEDLSGSPKRRQIKTIQHETSSETVKKSSTTSYTVTSSKTVLEASGNEKADTSKKVNGNTTVNGKNTQNSPLKSQESTLSSTYSSNSSSTYATEPAGKMPQARKRRNRKQKHQKNLPKAPKNAQDIIISTANKEEEKTYRVESPERKTLAEKSPTPMRKSKSLDDDDTVKIQELSETSDIDEKSDTNAIIVEPEPNNIVVPQIELISPEEELQLRNFLETLNLVNSPEDAQIPETATNYTMKELKERKATKRQAIEQYFFPMCQNPRFLDVISEEGSDLSDREQPSLTKHLKQGTPELEVPPPVPPRRNNPRILVGTKIIDQPVTHGSVPLEAELVYLEESTSGSSTPEPEPVHSKENLEKPINVVPLQESKIGGTSSTEEVVPLVQSSREVHESDISERKQSFHLEIKKNGVVTSKQDITEMVLSHDINKSKVDPTTEVLFSQLTPPPTPETKSPKSTSTYNLDQDNTSPKIYTNALNTTPSPTSSSGSDSSRGTSLCTIIPNSSVADIASIVENPSSLREICINYMMKQPFGLDVLQELSEVSKNLSQMNVDGTITANTTKNCLLTLNSASSTTSTTTKETVNKSDSTNVINKTVPSGTTSTKSGSHEIPAMNWYGLRTKDPNLLVCLTPAQKNYLESTRPSPNEGNELLESHNRYYSRSTSRSKENGSNSLLAIIRADNSAEQRLHAQSLNEWLRFADPKIAASSRRRRSEMYEEELVRLQEKERGIQRELEHLEEEKRKLHAAMAPPPTKFDADEYHISRRGDFAETKRRPLSTPSSSECFREQMYNEYMEQVAKREERKQLKVIKVTSGNSDVGGTKASATEIGDEFMEQVKAKQREGKLDKVEEPKTVYIKIEQEKIGEDPVLVMDGGSLKGAQSLPKHLQEFISLTQEESIEMGVWSPGQKASFHQPEIAKERNVHQGEKSAEPISPIWTPKSANSSPIIERKEFRPVKFESPVLERKTYKNNQGAAASVDDLKQAPWQPQSPETGSILSASLQKRLPNSHSSPGFHEGAGVGSRLPRVQNPTITLLQKAREGQLPKGALYIDHEPKRVPQYEHPPIIGPGEILYKIKSEYTSESESEKPRKMADLGPRKFQGIGPTTQDGMPHLLRSEVKDENQSKWYKKMYDTIHKQKPHRDEYITVRYKQRRAQHPYTSGYLSEPEPGAYDSDFTDYKYATLDRRRTPSNKENEYLTSTMPRQQPMHRVPEERLEPGRIEHYTPGHSSIADKEAKAWWDEVMGIFDGHLEQQKRAPPQPPQTRSFINQALKESGYESDSTLIFRRRDDTAQQLSPLDQKEAYKDIQKGGEIPLYGLRKAAPERPKESPRKYVENDVTIHYKTPVRQEIKEYLSEDELAYRQAETMKKIYQEERRRKYLQVSNSLQELQDMTSRRHTDNFIPSQKSPIPLNRYDDFDDMAPNNGYTSSIINKTGATTQRTPEPARLMAKALYNFVGQTARELTFRKGDIIYVRRQVDKNWYEGELNAMVGLFPVNYVEVITHSESALKSTPRKAHEGQARAKFNFLAQTHLELSLAKGELVVITRRVDDNWFEGKIGGRKGIFPMSYVEVLIDPGEAPPPPAASKPVAAPAAHSMLLNGSAGGKESMGSHSYTPNVGANSASSFHHAKPAQVVNSGGYGSLGGRGSQALHIETHSEPVPYRALYKYLPQNDDELELLEGDTVFVLEKCDDGWFVGSSERSGAFGTFPGNYVEKI